MSGKSFDLKTIETMTEMFVFCQDIQTGAFVVKDRTYDAEIRELGRIGADFLRGMMLVKQYLRHDVDAYVRWKAEQRKEMGEIGRG